MEELIVALHMHTVYSDGEGTHAQLANAGLGASALTFLAHAVDDFAHISHPFEFFPGYSDCPFHVF